MSAAEPAVTAFFETTTSTLTYLVADPASGKAMIVDPVLDYDWKAARTATRSADAVLEAARGLSVEWIVETHPHADHLTAAPYLKEKLGARIAIGAGIAEVQRTWASILDIELACDGSQFDRLLRDGERFALGGLTVEVLDVPGHTPACIALAVAGASGRRHTFIGDVLFMPDFGSARADFPGGSARQLFRSVRRLLALPPETCLYTAHDYRPGGRDLAYMATVAEHRARNLHVHDGVGEDAFVAMREARDAKLEAPNLLLPSIQVNIRAGALPDAAANGTRYLKIPLNRI
jgi:glyoxylase-like metal-dependent hydrolase (beta-lactamase superfamily II)